MRDTFNFFKERQLENDIRIIVKKSIEKKKENTKSAEPQKEKDTYEQAMDTSKYDKILNNLT